MAQKKSPNKGTEKKKKKQLKKKQKAALLMWIAAGLKTPEINKRAAKFKSPFKVSRQQVNYYRRTREHDIKALDKLSETRALIEGYATAEHRVYKLGLLAALLEKDLLGAFLWLEDKKGVGFGEDGEIFDYLKFNAAEVIQFRGVLDDIAKEVGGRILKVDPTGQEFKLIVEYANDKSKTPETS